MKNYKGSCQCGAVTFELNTEEIKTGMTCNCSRCHRVGHVLGFFPATSFVLNNGEENLTEYNFNKHAIHHFFCKTCGVQTFARGEDKGAEIVAVNLRCIEDLDIDKLEIQKANGKDF